MQSLWLIVIVFFVIVLILPISIKLNISFDFLKNLGAVSLYIFFIKIISFKIKFEGKSLILYSDNNKKKINFKLSEGKKRFLTQLFVQIKEKVIIKDCTAISRIGLNDAMNSALLTGLFNSVVGILYGKIKTTKKSSNLKIISNPEYNGNYLAFCVYSHIFITIFDFIYAILMSFLITKRSEKYERI